MMPGTTASTAGGHEAGAPSTAPSYPGRWPALAVIAIAQLMVVLDATIVNIALPTGPGATSHQRRQPAVGGHRVHPGLRRPPAARRPDRRLHRAASAPSSSACSASPWPPRSAASRRTAGMLFAARALQGAFGALMAPAALSLLTVTFTETKERARAFGVYGAIAGGGGRGRAAARRRAHRVRLVALDAAGQHPDRRSSRRWPRSAVSGRAGRTATPGTTYPVRWSSTAGLVALVYGFTKASDDGWTLDQHAGLHRPLASCWPPSSSSSCARRTRCCRCGSCWTATGAAPTWSSRSVGAGLFGVFLFLAFYLQADAALLGRWAGLAFLPFTVGTSCRRRPVQPAAAPGRPRSR